MIQWTLVLAFAALSVTLIWFWTRGRTREVKLSAGGGAAIFLLTVIAYRSDLAMQKLLSYLVMPAGLLWIGLGVLTVHLFARGLRGPARLSLALFLMHSICGNQLFASALLRALEMDIPAPAVADQPELDAILVHGGGVGFREGGEVQLTDQGDRIMLGARLWYAKKTRFLVASGSTIPGFEDVEDLSAAAERIWRDIGIPADVIRKSPEPKNTSQEIAAFKVMVDREGWKKVGVLSSRWHLPRIMRQCARVHLDAIPIAADQRGAGPIWHPALFVPHTGAWRATQLACWEMLGMIVGR